MKNGISNYKSTWKMDDDVIKELVARQREKQHDMLDAYNAELDEKRRKRNKINT